MPKDNPGFEGYPHEVKAEALELIRSGLPQTKVAEQIGCSAPTIAKWVKRWREAGVDLTADAFDEPDYQEPDEPELTEEEQLRIVKADENELARLRAELAAKDEEVRKLQEEAVRNAPYVDVSRQFLQTVEDLDEFYPEKFWTEQIARKLAATNRKNRLEGYPILDANDPGVRQVFIDEVKQEFFARRLGTQRPGPWVRKIKLVKPDDCDDYGWWNVYGQMVEPQINNTAGSIGDGIVRYTNKGYKITKPFLCAAGPCFNAAAVDSAGHLVYRGYCSQEHHDVIERGIDPDNNRVIREQSLIGQAVGAAGVRR